jgi:hypothetical protein
MPDRQAQSSDARGPEYFNYRLHARLRANVKFWKDSLGCASEVGLLLVRLFAVYSCVGIVAGGYEVACRPTVRRGSQ